MILWAGVVELASSAPLSEQALAMKAKKRGCDEPILFQQRSVAMTMASGNTC